MPVGAEGILHHFLSKQRGEAKGGGRGRGSEKAQCIFICLEVEKKKKRCQKRKEKLRAHRQVRSPPEKADMSQGLAKESPCSRVKSIQEEGEPNINLI